MADIISESGLSAGAIYGYYKGKEDLIQGAISDLLGRRIAAALDRKDGSAARAPGDLVTEFVTAIKDEAGDPGILLQVWAQAAVDASMQTFTGQVGAWLLEVFQAYLTRWYDQEYGFEHDDAAEAATLYAPLYVGIVQGYVVQSTIFSGFDREAYLAAASNIRPEPAHSGR